MSYQKKLQEKYDHTLDRMWELFKFGREREGELEKALSQLVEESSDYLAQNKCGCQHPHCRSCDNDQDLSEQIAQAKVVLSK